MEHPKIRLTWKAVGTAFWDAARGWKVLVTGEASVLLTILVYRLFHGQTPPESVFWAVLGACVPLALLGAWWTQYKQREEAELELETLYKPKFSLKVTSLGAWALTDQSTLILARVRTVNQGAESPIVEWKATYRSDSFRGEGRIRTLAEYVIEFGGDNKSSRTFYLRKGEIVDLGGRDLAVTSKQIQAHSATDEGDLPIEITKDVGYEFMHGQGALTVTALDYLGVEHSATAKLAPTKNIILLDANHRTDIIMV